jgi:hypothetical protein
MQILLLVNLQLEILFSLFQIIAYSPRSKLGTLLPDFPDIKDIKLPPNVAEDKVGKT